MTVYKDYEGIYGELSSTEKEDIGKFAADLMAAKLSNDAGKINELLKSAASDIDNIDDVEAFIGLASWLEKEASVETRNALSKYVLPIAGLAFQATPLAVAGVRAAGRAMKYKEVFKTILKEHPALKDDPNTSRYYDMIKSFSPDVASNALVAGNVMEELRQLGPAAVTPQRIGELLQLQGRIHDIRDRVPNMAAAAGQGSVKIIDKELEDRKEHAAKIEAEKKRAAEEAKAKANFRHKPGMLEGIG